MSTYPSRHRIRSGLTLIEVLVGLMILSVVGTAMVGVLLLATNLYQRGEASRGASDETMAVIAQLDADLARLTPRSQDGWLYAKVGDAAGNCVLAFTARREAAVTLDDAGTGLHQANTTDSSWDLIVWWATTGSDDGTGSLARNPTLYRAVTPIPTSLDPRVSGGWFDTVRDFASATSTNLALNGGTVSTRIITTGCLHIGTWVTFDGSDHTPRRTHTAGQPPDWEVRTTATTTQLPPHALTTTTSSNTTADTNAYDSDVLNNGTPVAWPLALRLSLTLTGGGRHATSGRLVGTIDATSTDLRFAGLGAVPEPDGYALVRIENEWVKGTMSGSGHFLVDATTTTATTTAAGRGARRSVAAAHDNGATVVTGLPIAIVRSLPR
jgi:prepilin-type N-terminal cleavage/methylation domain-containing protein